VIVVCQCLMFLDVLAQGRANSGRRGRLVVARALRCWKQKQNLPSKPVFFNRWNLLLSIMNSTMHRIGKTYMMIEIIDKLFKFLILDIFSHEFEI
jgi:hypothetical protein